MGTMPASNNKETEVNTAEVVMGTMPASNNKETEQKTQQK